MARQRLGQHFLADPGWREEIARAIRVSPQSLSPLPGQSTKSYCWIEIGAGHGEITEKLVASGAPVYAIELDAPLVAKLQKLAKHHPNLTVIRGDILETDIATLAAGKRIFIYGNLPYYITSPILRHLFNSADRIEEIHIVVQLEVAQRLAASPGTSDYGYLSVLTQYFSRPELVLEIPASAFSPPPEVTSALVTLRLPGHRAMLRGIDEQQFLAFVKLCFSQKRKTLVNNLRPLAKPTDVQQALGALNLRPDARAEQLHVEEFAQLARRLMPGGTANKGMNAEEAAKGNSRRV
jgi:16S rRNA (adenine1518-N6/adenine1519-N6)-dimethyltransferase